jgi:ankyrin repeat protein
MLLWGGAKPALTNNSKNTPLHEAVLADARDVAWLIVENGGDFTARTPNAEGRTPLEIARARGVPEVIEVLESA